MPQITKVRIANFKYSNGKRIIADELFDFEKGENGPSDVLFNMENGTGKSVLVQLMMQPIIPKAKLGVRRIENFFTKSTDHCYVVLEWALDNSKMKLLTGIAMAASDTSADPDSDRGFQIKYYTFISSYQKAMGEYDIASLPLSKKEKGKFVPASFDDIRNLAKKSNGKLVRYSSEDKMIWREKLAQYGIFQNEWRMIEELNSDENGMSKYFEKLNSSDALIDTLIIPRIEGKQNHSASKDDSSLETMLISYAKNYNDRQNIIREREECQGFFDMLKETKTEAENLWKSNDTLENAVKTLFAYSDAIERAILLRKQEQNQLDEQKETLDEKKKHIGWEKVSAEYYSCKEAYEKATEKFENADLARNEAEKHRDDAGHNLQIIESAHYYTQLVEIESRIKSITSEIESREHNTESSHKLAKLKYSAFYAITAELERITPEIVKLSETSAELKTAIAQLERELESIGRKKISAKTGADKAEAVLEKQMKDNDDIVEKLGIDTFRMIGGKYQAEGLDEWQNRCLDKIKSEECNIKASEKEIQELEEKQRDIPQKIADIQNQINIADNESGAIEKEITEYSDVETQIKGLCDKYSLDFGLRFTNHVRNYLVEQLTRTEADINAGMREKETTEEAVAAVKRGTLHIPKSVTDYLDGTGLHYTTFENYILEQQGKGLLSVDNDLKILSQYPYAAYGVILDDSDIDILFNESEHNWLPAVLPVFSWDDVEQILNGSYTDFRAVADYSRDYFLNKNEYTENLQQNAAKTDEHLDLLRKRKKLLLDDIRTAEEFSVYDEKWFGSKQTLRNEYERKISAWKNDIDQLKQEQADVNKRIGETRKSIDQQKDELNSSRNKLNEFNKLLERLSCEDELFHNLQTERKKLKGIETEEAEKLSVRQCKSDELETQERSLIELENNSEKLNEGLVIVNDAEKTDIITDEWNSLIEQYKALLEAQSADLKNLNDKKDSLLKQKADKEKEIKKRNCLPEEYSHIIYTEDQETEANKSVEDYEKLYKEKDCEYMQAFGAQSSAKGKFEYSRNGLDVFGGEPLPENEVGSLFDKRIKDIDLELNRLKKDRNACSAELARLQKAEVKTENITEIYARPNEYKKIGLERDYESQFSELTKKIRESESLVEAGSRRVGDMLKEMSDEHGTSAPDISRAICSMIELLSDEKIRGDRYYTLCDHIEANMHTAELRIAQIDIDLKEFQKTKGDIIHQCVIQGKQMYEGLKQIAINSKVKVQGKRRQMLHFDIPEVIDENVARASISAEIDKGTSALAQKLNEEGHTESEIRKIASQTVGSKRLLREYVGSETIVCKAYKIDRNPENSGYRTWEKTQVNNSGAEKFVVYFTIILALMAYTRDSYDDIDSKQNSSVLILDNPFGPISSKHVLEPMFEISRNYNVQMICLTCIDKSDIVSCFDLVIRAVVKQFVLSSKEQLTHEGNEMIEHGFYKSEQLNMF